MAFVKIIIIIFNLFQVNNKMESINNEKLINNESKQLFNKIKSKYILQIVFNFIKKNLSLEIIKKINKYKKE